MSAFSVGALVSAVSAFSEISVKQFLRFTEIAHFFKRFNNSFSSIILIPNCSALVNLVPAFSPATT